jgi:hypothetical protein
MSGSRKLMLNIFQNGENKISEASCVVCFYRVIELKQKMLRSRGCKQSIGIEWGVNFLISRIPLIGFEMRLG